MQYTWPQFKAFSRAVARAEAARQRDQFALMLIATRGNEDSIKAIHKAHESML